MKDFLKAAVGFVVVAAIVVGLLLKLELAGREPRTPPQTQPVLPDFGGR